MNSESYSFGGTALRGLLACAALVAATTSCEASPEAHVPMFGDGGMLRLGTPLTREQLYMFEGIFDLSQGSDLLGSDASVRTSNGTVSILTDKDAGYVVLGAACLPDQRVVLEGYWQYPTRVKAGLVRLYVDPPELAVSLCNGEVPDPSTELRMTGSYGDGDQYPTIPLSLGWAQELKPWRGRFFTTAHHGACEATDHCGVSQNSVETLRLADRIGSNAVEIDVRTTRDRIPVLFHDPGMSAALVDGLFCNGKIAELSLPELRANCTLRYGETIPTVREVLDSLINETEIEGVYLDMKVPDAVLPTARLVLAARADLEARNGNDDLTDDRTIGIVIAITTDEVLAAWHEAKATLEAEGLTMPPCLLEYDPDLVLSEGCVAWGPTWTEGPQVANVNKVRAGGAITIFWTINQSDFINEFLTSAHPNGIISARSALLFHRYQKIGTPPPLPGETE
jgi:glycerophosphoryl diester phosphodiesterase